jgi:isoleucyl-tRNA synthetase
VVEALLEYRLKPNLKLLGPRLGKQVGAVAAALADLDATEFVGALRTGGSAPVILEGGGQLRLADEEVLIETVSPEGFRVEHDGVRTVGLRTTVDESLRHEGLAREVVHSVQLARKNGGLRIEDTIALRLSLPGELRAVIEPEAAFVASETLASELSFGDAEGAYTDTARVGGATIGIGLTCTGTVFNVHYG